MQLTPFISPGLWCLTVTAGIINVAVKNKVTIPRIAGMVTVGAVATDYLYQYNQHHDPARLAGLLTFGIIFARVGLIVAHDFSDDMRRKIVERSFLASAASIIGGQLFIKHSFDPKTLLLIGSGLMGCFADYTNKQSARRKYTMVIGGLSLAFGLMTNNLGLAGKNIIADFFINGYSMLKNKDPLPKLPDVRRSLNSMQSLLTNLAG